MWLVNHGVDVNGDETISQKQPLVSCRSIDTVKTLVEQGAHMTAPDTTSLLEGEGRWSTVGRHGEWFLFCISADGLVCMSKGPG